MLALSVALMVGMALLRKHLADQMEGWNAAWIACGSYLLAVMVAAQFLPEINEVPDKFPAEML